MRTLQLLLILALPCAAGCRTNSSQFLLEQESRMFESEVYRLEAELEECCHKLEALRRENEDLRRELGRSPAAIDRSPATDTPRSTPPSRRAPPRLEPPTIELPEPSDTPPDHLIPGNEQPVMPGPSGAVEGRPTQLAINRRLTGGLDGDGAGDEGIVVMVEPRDDEGQVVQAPGAVSIVVMDPAETGDQARVARWDFQAHEFQHHFRDSTFGQGLQYELNWPGAPPRNRELIVFVRYIADDGTKLTTDAPLRLRLASDEPRQPKSRLKSPADERDDRGRARRTLSAPQQARGGRPEWRPYR